MPGFLLDENVDPNFRRAIQAVTDEAVSDGIVVWCIGDPDAPPRGTSDPDILVWCADRDMWLVTNNRRSMPVHLRDHLAAGRHSPGIFILNDEMTMGAVVEDLVLIHGASLPDEYADQIHHLPISFRLGE